MNAISRYDIAAGDFVCGDTDLCVSPMSVVSVHAASKLGVTGE
jgi:hypothetical protein